MATLQNAYPLMGKSTKRKNLIQPFALPFALATIAFSSFFLPFVPLLARLVGHLLSARERSYRHSRFSGEVGELHFKDDRRPQGWKLGAVTE